MTARTNWLTERGAGILLHPTSLPGSEGIGVLGAEAEAFIDFLAEAEILYWQLLPLGPTGYGNSPYQSFSAFAGNPYLICLEELAHHGLLSAADLDSVRHLRASRVDFGSLYQVKWPILRHAHRQFVQSGRAYLPNYGMYDDFKAQHADWLIPYTRFMALKDKFGGRQWTSWPEPFRSADVPKAEWQHAKLAEVIEFHCFVQYVFFGQWLKLRQHAQRRGVQIVGDMPIFVAMDSSDVWANREDFEIDDAGNPRRVAGVPPDYFAEDGQLWGNPLYDWDRLAQSGYRWWLRRFELNFTLFDIVRIDHFRGFQAYWEIPADAETAKSGRWRAGPGMDLFNAVFEALPEARIIAEDLGDIDEAVHQLREDTGFPGMAVLQFAFDGDNKNLYLPHNLQANSVLYTGTHDNDTTLGWYEAASNEVQDQLRRYFRISGDDISWDFIRAAYSSTSRICIVPMQDLLSLDTRSRMNRPGTREGNWEWRMTDEEFNWQSESSAYLAELAWLYDR